MKKIIMLAATLFMCACSVENNITFSTTQGNCSDGTSNASYCMAVTIQNNNGGQNYINSTNFPISNLTLSISGAGNVNYPTTPGASNDPNNCLGSNISPGGSCTFYLWLSGESQAVGIHTPITLSANYTINNSVWGNSTTSGSSNLTIYETPGLNISSTTGYVQIYNYNKFNTQFRGESSNQAYGAANDNYYGFLYLTGNQGIYFSGNGTYAGNATANTSTFSGANNLIINGQTLYAVPIGSVSTSVYYAGLQRESFGWSQYASGLPQGIAANVSTSNGNKLFFAVNNSGIGNVYACVPGSTSIANCSPEGGIVPNSGNITAMGFTTLGTTTSGAVLTGLLVGGDNGLWVESGTVGSSTNQWIAVTSSSSVPIKGVTSIVPDINNNLYIGTTDGHFYVLRVNGNTQADQSSWTVPGTPKAAVTDNAAKKIYVANKSGMIYLCPLDFTGTCEETGQSFASDNNLLGLNIITQLTSS